MGEKGSNKMLLLAALSSLFMVSTVESSMLITDGFTIELPVWFQVIPNLSQPGLAPFKEIGGQPNAITYESASPPKSQFYPNRASQMEYGQPGYQDRMSQMDYNQPGFPSQVQSKPVPYPTLQQYPRSQDVYYRPVQEKAPVMTTVRTTSRPTTLRTLPTRRTGIPPAPMEEEETEEAAEENPEQEEAEEVTEEE